MDIKVGNDIKLNVTMPEYIDPSSILRITAVFKNHSRCKHAHHYFCYPSRYTMHPYSCIHYNVHPHNAVCGIRECEACCSHYNNKHRNRVIVVKPTGLNHFELWFNNTTNYDLGEYDLVLNIQAYEDGWNYDNVHEYTVSYGPVFSISNKSDAQEGNIVIDVNKD